MEDNNVIIWSNGTPAAISQTVADKHGVTRGQRFTDVAQFNALIEENNARNACSIDAQLNGEECIVCGS